MNPLALKVVGGVAGVAIIGLFVALQIEKTSHASTLKDLAEARTTVADLRTQQANSAAERAEAVEAALADQAEQMQALIDDGNTLRRELVASRSEATETRNAADSRIRRLLRENEELRTWAATRIPSDWIDFMRVAESGAAPPGTGGS